MTGLPPRRRLTHHDHPYGAVAIPRLRKGLTPQQILRMNLLPAGALLIHQPFFFTSQLLLAV